MSGLEQYFRGIDKHCIYELYEGVYLERSGEHIYLNVIATKFHVSTFVTSSSYDGLCMNISNSLEGLYKRISQYVRADFYLMKR